MTFGHDTFGINTHVFESNENEIVYGGYTIRHLPNLSVSRKSGSPISTIDYTLKTTVVGTDFENLITQENLALGSAVNILKADKEHAESKAMTYIDGITDDDVNRNNSNGGSSNGDDDSNGNGNGNGNGNENGNGDENETKETNWLLIGGVGLVLLLLIR